jgi:serine phosphatase RsbU (regulator of sigma subunit)
MYRMDGHHVVTYAERFAKQYAEFQQGAAQHASGTPLEKLSQYGISGAQLSLCRALKIYSIEALHSMEGTNLKALGMNQNALKDMARRYMEDRAAGGAVSAELAALRAELEALKNPIPVDAKADADVLPDGYEAMTDVELKDAIEAKVGARPRGNPSRETLVRMLSEAGA